MKALDVLERAISLVTGRRQQDYGNPADNFQRIADGWNIIVKSTDGDLTCAHVAMMMDWMKSARLLQSIDHVDSWTDKAGYAALGAQLAVTQPDKAATGPTLPNPISSVGPNDIKPYRRDYSQG